MSPIKALGRCLFEQTKMRAHSCTVLNSNKWAGYSSLFSRAYKKVVQLHVVGLTCQVNLCAEWACCHGCSKSSTIENCYRWCGWKLICLVLQQSLQVLSLWPHMFIHSTLWMAPGGFFKETSIWKQFVWVNSWNTKGCSERVNIRGLRRVAGPVADVNRHTGTL